MRQIKMISIIALTLISLSCQNSSNRNIKAENANQTMIMAEKIKIDGLKNALIRLQNKQTEYNFIGITSNGIDCIYFVFENGNFNIEFEAMTEEQVPYMDKLKEYASSKKFKSSMLTYNNKPNYKSDKPAPVIRIETNSAIDQITEIGINIQTEIFKNTKETVYDVVP